MSTKDTNPKDSAATNKVPLALLSPIAKAHWALAQFSGMIKYGAHNWRIAGVRASVYLSAIDRHLSGYLSGEEHDPVDGTHHLGNIMACCAILLDAKAAGKLTDDRPPSVGMRPTYAEIEAQMAKLREQYKDKEPRHYTIEDTEYRLEEDYCPGCDHGLCQCPEWRPKVGDRVKILTGSYANSLGEVREMHSDHAFILLIDDKGHQVLIPYFFCEIEPAP